MTSERLAYIDATIGELEIRFELKRDAWTFGVLEALGLSPFGVYTRLGRGSWSHETLEAVLSLAYTPGRDLIVEAVVALIAAQPYGQLVPLLGKVLEAHLFGVPAERAAFPGAPA